ncbi:MAG: TIGR04283 family arsenosugar biosynthesis glycosyltransferase [Gammaproteobacteria bacterium]|nr:TIGR04283 family arsenosugar biosynthesis glycosyltransferase [Gammaproteobacteria bacterium]HRX72226.1 TIGR04283 family arsenosugar biosynthesis glycosyltransferase [Candidatus Competibacteraceae bacterium]
MPAISIILPTLNEEAQIVAGLQALQPLRGQNCELIVADGGSRDRTAALAKPLVDQVIMSARGRAAQMNAGASKAQGDILWFLHADSLPPPDALDLIHASLSDPHRCWGRFDVRLSGRHPALRVVETLMNIRSRLTGIATGDQGIFVRRTLFEQIGGYPSIALMEDIALSRLLKRHGRPVCLRQPLQTSSRRWERDGIARTILLMWQLRLAYFFGADPDRLARSYYRS